MAETLQAQSRLKPKTKSKAVLAAGIPSDEMKLESFCIIYKNPSSRTKTSQKFSEEEELEETRTPRKDFCSGSSSPICTPQGTPTLLLE